MHDLTAYAVKVDSLIEVTVFGYLPDSCHEARIVDIYPGGSIVYVKDPGYAQVFISENHKVGMAFCLPVLVPWVQTTYINDNEHKEVEILVNNQKVLKVPVVEKGGEFIVLKLTGGTVPNGGYHIAPDGLYVSIYTKVFGPASYADCLAKLKELDGYKSLSISILGGGSEAPRGLL